MGLGELFGSVNLKLNPFLSEQLACSISISFPFWTTSLLMIFNKRQKLMQKENHGPNLTLNLVLTYATYIRCLTVSAENSNPWWCLSLSKQYIRFREKKRSVKLFVKIKNREKKYFDELNSSR